MIKSAPALCQTHPKINSGSQNYKRGQVTNPINYVTTEGLVGLEATSSQSAVITRLLVVDS